jgi:heme-degrading monooxygenase HmoA
MDRKEADVVTIGMNYRVLPDKEEIFESTFRKVLSSMKKIEGHSFSKMFRDIDEPNHYVILSEWNDRSAFDSFVSSETFRNVTNWGKEEILAGRPVHTYYDH